MEPKCPWCGEQLYNPVNGREITARSSTRTYDLALEVHAEECEPFQDEQKPVRGW